MKTTLRRAKTRAYHIIDRNEPFLLSFAHSANILLAAEHDANGAIVKTRAVFDVAALAITEPPSGQNACCVRDDATVDHGSLAWRDGRTLRVWSPEQGIVHSHTVAADRVVSPPVAVDGWLYWLELPAVETLTWELKTARANFNDLDTVDTAAPDPLGFGFVFEWQAPKAIVHTGQAVIGSAWWRTLDFETGVASVRFEFNRPPDVRSEHDLLGRDDEHDRLIALPHDGVAYGTKLSTDGDSSSARLGTVADAVDTVFTSYWPSGDWRIFAPRNGDAYRGRGLVYGESSDGDPRVIVSSIDPPHVDPEHYLEPQPIDGTTPDLIFLGGSST